MAGLLLTSKGRCFASACIVRAACPSPPLRCLFFRPSTPTLFLGFVRSGTPQTSGRASHCRCRARCCLNGLVIRVELIVLLCQGKRLEAGLIPHPGDLLGSAFCWGRFGRYKVSDAMPQQKAEPS